MKEKRYAENLMDPSFVFICDLNYLRRLMPVNVFFSMKRN